MNLYFYIWIALGAVFIISELFIPGFTIFFFGCGAVFTALISLIIPSVGSSSLWQIIIWMTTSILSLIFFRNRFTSAFKGRLHRDETENFIGKEARVIEEVSEEKSGRISIRGTSWKAESIDGGTFYNGETVIIDSRKESESLTFYIRKKNQENS